MKGPRVAVSRLIPGAAHYGRAGRPYTLARYARRRSSQGVNAMLTGELSDNAAWELLIGLPPTVSEEQNQQNDDGNWHTEQPEQYCGHFVLLRLAI